VRATEKLHTVPEGHSVLIWLRTTARNYFLDRQRRSVVERQSLGVGKTSLAPAPLPQRELEDSLLTRAGQEKTKTVMERCLAGMKPLDRRVMALRAAGWQKAGICDQLGISEQECRRCYARIRFLLKKMRLRGFPIPLSELMAAAEAKGEENEAKPN